MTETKKNSSITPSPKVWAGVIDKMLKEPEFSFAQEFLEDVRAQIEDKGEISLKQTQAIIKIRRSKQ